MSFQKKLEQLRIAERKKVEMLNHAYALAEFQHGEEPEVKKAREIHGEAAKRVADARKLVADSVASQQEALANLRKALDKYIPEELKG